MRPLRESVEVMQSAVRAGEQEGVPFVLNARTDALIKAGDRPRSEAIAEAKQLSGPVAPYFIDADATPNPGGWPRGGLTVVRFANSHLVYALTWFGLALMSAGGAVLWLREERCRRLGRR